jgi:hypothetical protein
MSASAEGPVKKTLSAGGGKAIKRLSDRTFSA